MNATLLLLATLPGAYDLDARAALALAQAPAVKSALCPCGVYCLCLWPTTCGCGMHGQIHLPAIKKPACTCGASCPTGWRNVFRRDYTFAGRQCTCGCGRFHPAPRVSTFMPAMPAPFMGGFGGFGGGLAPAGGC